LFGPHFSFIGPRLVGGLCGRGFTRRPWLQYLIGRRVKDVRLNFFGRCDVIGTIHFSTPFLLLERYSILRIISATAW
jgi:hypothetical protein